MEKDRVLQRLETADWKDIILRLTHYARQRARFYSWKSGRSDQLLGGKTPEDIACGAIEKVWAGTRDWNPDKYPNLLTHLEWIVKSDTDHLASSMEHKAIDNMPEHRDREDSSTSYEETIPDPLSTTPEMELIAHEEKELEEKLKGELYAMVKGDDDLEMLLLCFEEGINKPEIIATQTGWDISKVYNLKKKLFRKVSKMPSNPQHGG